MSFGIRQAEEEHDPQWKANFALYNARPGTMQRMPVFLYASAGPAEPTREAVLAFTHGDRYKPIAGYQTMLHHVHARFGARLRDAGSPTAEIPDLIALKAIGINIVSPVDPIGPQGDTLEGQLPADRTPADVLNLQRFRIEGARHHSDRDFLVLPTHEIEPSPFLGHIDLLYSHPTYWVSGRTAGQPLVDEMAPLRPLLSHRQHRGPDGDGEAGGHPPVDASSGLEVQHGLSGGDQGPVVLQGPALPELRVQVGHGSRSIGAAPVRDSLSGPAGRDEQLARRRARAPQEPAGDLRGAPPGTGRRRVRVRPDHLRQAGHGPETRRHERADPRAGERRLVRDVRRGAGVIVRGDRDRPRAGTIVADVEWTFPLDFVEVVWGDGERTSRQVISTTERPQFGRHRFEVPFEARRREMGARRGLGHGGQRRPHPAGRAPTPGDGRTGRCRHRPFDMATIEPAPLG